MLQPLFSPQRMKKLSDDIRGVVNALIDGFAPKGQAEFISEFAHELPARIFLALMDWPVEDAPLFTDATDVVLFGKPGGTQEESDQARIAAGLTVAGAGGGVLTPGSGLMPAGREYEFPSGAMPRPAGFSTGAG